jgi:uncharacterized membrane protein (DUF106 family)
MTFLIILSIVTAALLSTSAAEGISYLLVYRTSKYKSLTVSLEKHTKKYEQLKEQQDTLSHSTSRTKKWTREEDQMKKLGKELFFVQFRATIVVGLFMMVIFTTLTHIYEGIVAARLPFTPLALLRGISHRGLKGDDMMEASAMFLYVLSSIVFRQILQRIMGFAVKMPPMSQKWMTMTEK